MSRRFTYEEKGKASASSQHQPKVSRIRAPESDNSDLLQRHKLTVIGRLTNPIVQRAWALIPVFTDHWKIASRPIGADLGHDLFQFQFATEEDLQVVLTNRPYHFAGYMVIIQRWEPTISRSFPSEIPFWIQVKGIPVHLWTTELIRSIGEDIGAVEEVDVTTTMARMRVRINGLQPLIKASYVEFRDGEELAAELIYERLKKHCKVCFRLDHDDKACPMIQAPRDSRLPLPPQRRYGDHHHKMPESPSHGFRREVSGSRNSRPGGMGRQDDNSHPHSKGHSSFTKEQRHETSHSRHYPSNSHRERLYSRHSQDHPAVSRRSEEHRDSSTRYAPDLLVRM